MKFQIIRQLLLLLFLALGLQGHSQEKWIALDGSPEGTAPTVDVIKSDNEGYSVKINFHGFYSTSIKQGNTVFNELSFGSLYGTTAEIGSPALPVFSRTIAFPQGKIGVASIVKADSMSMDMGVIYPYQKDFLEAEQEEFVKNTLAYDSDVLVSKLLDKSMVQIYRGISNTTYYICPFTYHPKQQRLQVYKEVIFDVKFKDDNSRSANANNKIWANKQDLALFDNEISLSSVQAQADAYDYLIVVGDNSTMLNSATLKDFCKWKAFKGFKTKVVSTSTTGSTCESIKAFIRSEYEKYGIRYVLFVGDDDKIPLYLWDAYGKPQKSDYWYGCMKSGDTEYQADIAIGRFSTNDVNELANMVNKTISYESTENKYAQQVLLVAHKEDAPNEYQQISENISNKHKGKMQFSKVYGAVKELGGTNGTNADIIAKINAGVNVVNYRGHGDWDQWKAGWSMDSIPFTATEVSQLKNSSYPVIFAIACLTSNIKDHTCLMESFMRSKNGSVAYLGATEESLTRANHNYNEFLFNSLLNKGIYSFGDLNKDAQFDNGPYNRGDEGKINAFCYLLGGDPTLEILTQVPQKFTNVKAERTSELFQVSTDTISSYKVSVVSADGTLLYSTEANSNTVSLANVPSDGYIILNKHNFIPYVIKVAEDAIIYIQNDAFTNSQSLSGDKLEVGSNVTTLRTKGNVIIKEGADLKLKGNTYILIKNDFECEKGASLNIQ